MTDYPHKKKYEPLGERLAALPRGTVEATFSFAEVEAIIGDKLPPSAFKHREWWSNQQGGSRAPHWRSAGFAVDHADLRRRVVLFRRVAPSARLGPHAMSLNKVVTAVNEGAQGRAVGGLQEWRKKRYGMARLASATLFYAQAEEGRNYVFHVGGLSELQFNVGFEPVDDIRTFRHGVAFSLQTTREFPDIAPLVPKVARFNEYLRIYPEAFEGFSMWYWPPQDKRSSSYPVVPIPDELIRKGYFIFIGRLQPAEQIDVGLILDDFDRLLPLYEYVEGEETETFPARVPESERRGFVWSSGKKSRALKASYEQAARTVEKELWENALQDALFDYLENIQGMGSTKQQLHTGNGTLIDVAVREGDRYTYYEIKTYSSAQACIREALGQLLEYSYWPGANKAYRLVIVGEAPCDKKAKAYIEHLRKDFSLPIEYRQFEMKSCRLIE